MVRTQGRQITPREQLALPWIGHQYAIRFDQAQRLLFRSTPEQDRYKLKPGSNCISMDRTYEIINKWTELGLVEHHPILYADKKWIWLSRRGLREFQLPYTYGNGAPSSAHIPHIYAMNQVRLAIEEKRPGDLWKSERQLRKEVPHLLAGEKRPHMPDAILTNMTNGQVTAIEVERNAGNDDDLEEVLRELAASYPSIWYVATSATLRQVSKIVEQRLTSDMRNLFRLSALEEYTHNEYGLS